MKNALVKTDFKFPGQKSVYHGKVRDVYNIDDELLVMVVSDCLLYTSDAADAL